MDNEFSITINNFTLIMIMFAILIIFSIANLATTKNTQSRMDEMRDYQQQYYAS